MLYELAYGLAERGHSVTVFASKGSRLAAPNLKLVEVIADDANLNLANFNTKTDSSTESGITDAFFDQSNLFMGIFLEISKRHAEFDIVHAHAFDWPAYAFGAFSPVPVIHTLHLPAVDNHINKLLATTAQLKGSSNCVTVSKTCAATYSPFFNCDKVIYNGIKTTDIPFGKTPDDFAIFVGRMSLEKGADLAIEIARKAGLKLLIAGGMYDQTYFNTKIAPLLLNNSDVEYLGLLDRSKLFPLMSKAKAAIFPARWSEPFGLALAEAQAAGTPVIAFKRGAATEIVVQGETGFLVEPDDVDAAALALSSVDQIERMRCREHIEENFSFDQMLDAYEDYYYSKLSFQADSVGNKN